MQRFLAAFVVLALAVFAIPSATIAPVCHRCCDEPRLAAGGGEVSPCCRVSPDAPRPVARQVPGRADTSAVLTTPPVVVVARSGLSFLDRLPVVVTRHHQRTAVLRI